MDAQLDPPPSMEDGTARPSLRALIGQILRRPSAAMKALAAEPGRRWVWPLLALTLLSVVLMLIITPRQFAAAMAGVDFSGLEGADGPATDVAGFGQRVAVLFSAVGAGMGVIIGTAAAAAVLHFASTIMGGQQGFMTVFTTTAWAKVPLILRAIVQILWFGTHPSDYDAQLSGLAGLTVSSPGDPDPSWWQPLLAQIEIWNLWYLVLLWLGVRAFARVSGRKATMVVGALVLVRIVVGLVGVGVAGAVAGFTG